MPTTTPQQPELGNWHLQLINSPRICPNHIELSYIVNAISTRGFMLWLPNVWVFPAGDWKEEMSGSRRKSVKHTLASLKLLLCMGELVCTSLSPISAWGTPYPLRFWGKSKSIRLYLHTYIISSCASPPFQLQFKRLEVHTRWIKVKTC